MEQIYFLLGSLFAALGVVLGAFGAHALKARIPPQRLESFETGVRYQMYHALALLGTAFALSNWKVSAWLLAAGWLFIAGTLLFSGSLYALVFSGKRAWGAVTPFGGLAFILGWVCLGLGVWLG
jgi:uncharacterized membrane protein YgdD (TMEM256/DUF423 family)